MGLVNEVNYIMEKFQFLIGQLEIMLWYIVGDETLKFQFLIGQLEIRIF